MLAIGPYTLDSQVLLAPMAGVTDLPFRSICRDMGAGLTTTEMVTSDVSLWDSDKSRHRLTPSRTDNAPLSVQIAGSDPELMAQAARHAVKLGAQIVDINMGCPAKKVCKKLAGSALLKDENLVANILSTVVDSVDVPVTLKTRTGWDHSQKNGPKVAQIAEESGIQALVIHGRTRACKFEGQAEYDTIANIVDRISIPVIANGDITDGEKAKRVLDITGAAGLMIGRAAFGNPWIFKKVSHYLSNGIECSDPTEDEIQMTMEAHLKELYRFYGDIKGVRIARKHFAWYCQNFLENARPSIKTFNQLENSQSQIDAVRNLFKRPNIYEEKVA